jgi:hypothetical protein
MDETILFFITYMNQIFFGAIFATWQQQKGWRIQQRDF